MNQPQFQVMEQCSPANCLEILRAFSGTNNGEATVTLMLRHIAQMLEVSKVAVVFPQLVHKSKLSYVSIDGYDPLQWKSANDTVFCVEIALKKDGKEFGTLHFIDEKGKSGLEQYMLKLETAIEILIMALEKWHDEKLKKLEERTHERLERRLKRQNRFLNSLYRISLDMVNQKEYERLMNTILRHAQKIMDASFASIYLVNERLGMLEMKFIGPNVDSSVKEIRVKPGQGGAGLVWQTGKFLIIHDYPHWPNRVQLSWLDEIGTIAFVPLVAFEKIVGIICLGFVETTRQFAPDEKALLQQFANLAAMMSENVRLLNAAIRRDEEFTRDIMLAAEVQQTYLPFNYDDPRVQVKTIFQPLHLVSGDIFDYFWSMQGEVLFGYLADVTGHGVTAGLRTAALSVLFRESASLSLPLVEKMKWVHGRSLGYFSEGAYFAAICFELDLRQGELRVVCGGLYEFFIKTRYFIGRIEMSGSLMGLKKTPSFEERTYPARQGDCFYFLTDGFSDLLEIDKFPKLDFHETCRSLEEMRNSSLAWDDKAGICIQLKPDKSVLLNKRPELQVCFIGFDEFHLARLQITAFIERYYPHEADEILLAFHEAAGNALRHGSVTRPVFIRVRDYAGHVSIRIKDSGRGFDSISYLNSERAKLERHEINSSAFSGRGIGIMLECVDRVCYSVSGNEVLLIKKTRHHH